MSQDHHLTIPGIGQQRELINRVAKVSGEQHTNGNSVGDQYVVSGSIQVERAPQGIEKGRNSVKDIGSRFAMWKPVKEGAKSMALPLVFFNLLRYLGVYTKSVLLWKPQSPNLNGTYLIVAEILFSYSWVLVPRQPHLQ